MVRSSSISFSGVVSVERRSSSQATLGGPGGREPTDHVVMLLDLSFFDELGEDAVVEEVLALFGTLGFDRQDDPLALLRERAQVGFSLAGDLRDNGFALNGQGTNHAADRQL